MKIVQNDLQKLDLLENHVRPQWCLSICLSIILSLIILTIDPLRNLSYRDFERYPTEIIWYTIAPPPRYTPKISKQPVLQVAPMIPGIFFTLRKVWSIPVATYTYHIAYSLIQFRYCVQYARNALKEHFLVNFWGRHIQKTKSKKILLAKVETRFSRSGTQIITDREP